MANEDPASLSSIMQAARQGKADVDQIAGAVDSIMKFIIDLIVGIAYLLLTIPPAFVIVFIRYNFGERFLRVIDVLGVVTLLVWLGVVLPEIRSSLWWYAAAYGVVGIIHLNQIYERRKAGRRWHSKCPGLPLPIWRKLKGGDDPWFCRILIEPFVLIVAGGVAWIWFRTPLAMLPLLAASSLFVLALMQYYHQRNQMLDAIDQQIEAENRAAALDPEIPPSQTEGYTVPGSRAWTPRERMDLNNFYGKLDPGLKELMGVEMKPSDAGEGGSAQFATPNGAQFHGTSGESADMT